MIAFPAGMQVMVATKPIDFRKGADGLAALVRETLGQDPFLCVGRDYVAAHPRSPQLSGNAGLCRHILSGHLFSRLGMFSARLQWGEDHVGTVFQV
jgi:transposase